MPSNKTIVLLVDDEPNFVFMVKNRLQARGYEVVTASDGKAALEQIRSAKPDLILLDVLMPVMDGWEALQQLQESRGTKKIPVIMFSAKGQPDDLKLSRELGAVDYILKPFEPVELIQKIEKAIQNRVFNSA